MQVLYDLAENKTQIHTFFAKIFEPESLVGNGGRPGSYSATVCALSLTTFLNMEHPVLNL